MAASDDLLLYNTEERRIDNDCVSGLRQPAELDASHWRESVRAPRRFGHIDISLWCGLPEPRQHVWDFRELQWWSRIFEYQWLKDVVGAFLAPDLETKTVLDVGCGLEHPGCFMLAESGFGRVVAQDVWERHELIERIHLPNLEYCCMDINEAVPCGADLVCCLSVLEHMDPQQRACALRILCDAVEPGGLLLLTFDMPGFEWDTDLDMYRHILRQREFDFIEVEVPEGQRVTSLTSPVPYAGWESLGHLKLECYRLLAWHTGVGSCM